jgi:anti-anti-sigma factor
MQLPGTVDHIGNVQVLALAGEYDLSNAPALAAELRVVARQSQALIVDLSSVDFLDSTALQVLFEASAGHRSAGTFAVIAPEHSWAGRLVELTGFRNAAPVFADRESALAALAQE